MMFPRWRALLAAIALLALPPGLRAQLALPQASTTGTDAPLSATGERIYANARASLLQIRTIVAAANRQSSIGSGFLVDAGGLAITNYHVVSQYALEPKTYQLEYTRPDGGKGALALLAIDVADDLAVVRVEGSDLPHLEFEPRAIAGELPRGERAWAMGNPLDLGFTIVEGTWNGLVEHSYNERVHFTGAINPGMSGGPAVDASTRVVGINVAKRLDGELVSFLVPATKAKALLERARLAAPLDPAGARAEIARQLLDWQQGFYAALAQQGLRQAPFGPYVAAESEAQWFNCWAQTNAEQTPPPRAQVDGSSCSTPGSLFVADDLDSGSAEITHAYVRSSQLDAFQFATFLSPYYRSATMTRSWSRKRLTPPQCHEAFVAPRDATAPSQRAIWCARAYRDFDGLYDVSLTSVTQDRDREALVSRATLRGVSYDNALAFGRRFMDALAWKK